MKIFQLCVSLCVTYPSSSSYFVFCIQSIQSHIMAILAIATIFLKVFIFLAIFQRVTLLTKLIYSFSFCTFGTRSFGIFHNLSFTLSPFRRSCIFSSKTNYTQRYWLNKQLTLSSKIATN
jgi:hypothetical protein